MSSGSPNNQRPSSITEVTRRNIIDTLITSDVVLYGRLHEMDFLKRLYDFNRINQSQHIRKLYQQIYRVCDFPNVEEDIMRHRGYLYPYSNEEMLRIALDGGRNLWPDYWIFQDPRFQLLKGPDEIFLSFLCEMVHPVVRSDEEEVARLVDMFNQYLAADGWEVVEVTRISDRPVYAARSIATGPSLPMEAAEEIAEQIDSSYVSQQVTQMETSLRDGNTRLAIGTAKEFVETICKTILKAHGITGASKIYFPELVRTTMKQLRLLPEEIHDRTKAVNAFKVMMMNLASISDGTAFLRNKFGTGHGDEANAEYLPPHVARLIVHAANTLGVFLFEADAQERAK